MTAIKGEIETLENAEAPKDYTMETILEWLDSIKKAPDQRAVELLIKKITVSRENNKTDFKIESEVCLRGNGCGGRILILDTDLPADTVRI